MRTLVFATLVLLAVGWSACSTSPNLKTVPPADPQSRVQVNFDHPENFTDAKTRAGNEFDPAVLEQLRAVLTQAAAPYVPAGRTLSITFTNIDLAGDLEPWHIRAHDVRIIKEIYPPHAAFTWVLKDAAGAVLREGSEQLTDLNFMSRASIGRGALFYDEEMLRDWVALRRWR
jgi:hypothetical protein